MHDDIASRLETIITRLPQGSVWRPVRDRHGNLVAPGGEPRDELPVHLADAGELGGEVDGVQEQAHQPGPGGSAFMRAGKSRKPPAYTARDHRFTSSPTRMTSSRRDMSSRRMATACTVIDVTT